jgi:uncharacterized repeat protein (TIGR02543 family)
MRYGIKPRTILALAAALILALTMRIDVVAASSAENAGGAGGEATDIVVGDGIGSESADNDEAAAGDTGDVSAEAGSQPEDAELEHLALEDSAPIDAAPADGTPKGGALADGTPEDGAPAGVAPEDSAPTDGAPAPARSKDAVFANAVSASDGQEGAPISSLDANLTPATSLAGNLALLETCAEDFLASNPVAAGWLNAVNGEHAATWLSFAYLRQFNSSYNTDRWGAIAGTMGPTNFQLGISVSLGPVIAAGGTYANQCYDRFTASMTANQVPLHTWFTTNATTDGIDVAHMAAAASALRYNCLQQGGLLGPGLSMAMNEQEYDDLSGWAGDLQTFAINLTDAFPTLTEQEYATKAQERLGQMGTTFDTADLKADADAVNLCALIAEGQSLTEAATNYYSQGGANRRYTSFVQNANLFGDGRIAAYTSQTNPRNSNTWLIYSNASKTINPTQSAGIATGIRAAFDALLYAELPRYTVSFEANGGTPTPDDITDAVEGNTISEPTAPAKTGYLFGGWYRESACINVWNFSSDTVTQTIELYAKWTPAPGTAYATQYYQQKLDGSYELAQTVWSTAETGSTVTAAARTYEGFHENATHADRVPQATVAPDGSTTLSLYYDRDVYLLNFLDMNSALIGVTQSVMYGARVPQVPMAPPVYALDFLGWRMVGASGLPLTGEQVKNLALLQDTAFYACYLRPAGDGIYLRVSGLDATGEKAVADAFAAKEGLSLDGRELWMADVALCDALSGAEVSGGGTISLPYPNDTVSQAYQNYDFYVLHLKNGVTPEFLSATPASDGIVVTVESFSPFAVAYSLKDETSTEETDDPEEESTTDSDKTSNKNSDDKGENNSTGNSDNSSGNSSGNNLRNLPATGDLGTLIAVIATILFAVGVPLSAVSAALLCRCARRGSQQMRGSCSPTSMSRTRVEPKAVRT